MLRGRFIRRTAEVGRLLLGIEGDCEGDCDMRSSLSSSRCRFLDDDRLRFAMLTPAGDECAVQKGEVRR
jgi:hypothetical protein